MACNNCGASYTADTTDPQGPTRNVCPACASNQADLNTKHSEFVRWYEEWETTTEDARDKSERDDDYYHGLQLTDDEVQDLKDRGQPIIIKNRIFKKINFLLGQEINNRADPKALPRTRTHEEDVQAITDAIRFVCDEEDFDQVASRTWGQLMRLGYAGAIVEHEERTVLEPIAADTTTTGTGNVQQIEHIELGRAETTYDIKIRRVPYDRLWFDCRSREEDFSDAKYLGITTWWHLSEAIGHYADKEHRVDNYEEILRQAIVDSRATTSTHEDKPRWAYAGSSGDRVRTNEVYYRDLHPETRKIVWFVAHYAGSGLIVPPRPTGHKNDRGEDICPLVATTAFVTREGVRYPLARHMIGPQDEINKRSSKSLHHQITERITVEEGVLIDEQQAREERAKPDGIVEVARGALVEGRLQYDKGLQEAQVHMAALEAAKGDIDQIGPEIPQIGTVGAGSSGRALQQRQMIGALEIAPLIDNLRRWRREMYKRIWWKVKQLWTEEMWLRVRDDPQGKGYRFVGLNRSMTKGERFQELVDKNVPPDSALLAVNVNPVVMQEIVQRLTQQVQASGVQIQPQEFQQLAQQALLQSPPMQEMMTAADVAAIDVDIIIEESPDVAIVQHEELQELRETLQSYMASGQADPAISRELIKLVIKAGQLRSKQQLIDMMEQPPDPQQQQIQQQQMQLQMQSLQAQVQVLMSQAALNQARAAAEQVDAEATQVKTPAEVDLKKAQALKAQAEAGEKTGQVLAGG